MEHYDWLAALGLMMRERQFRVSRLRHPPPSRFFYIFLSIILSWYFQMLLCYCVAIFSGAV